MSKLQLLDNTPLLWLLTSSVAAPLTSFMQTLLFGLILIFTNAGYGGGVERFQDGLVIAAVGGAAIGAVWALIQLVALLHTPVSRWLWIASTIAGFSLCNIFLYVVLCLVSEYAPSFIDLLGMAYMDDIGPHKLFGYCAMLALGVVQGAIVSILQWRTLRSVFEESKQWIWMTSIGLTMWFVLPLIIMSGIYRTIILLIPHESIVSTAIFITGSLPYILMTTLAIKRIVSPTPTAREGEEG
jgi:hypothetical protein